MPLPLPSPGPAAVKCVPRGKGVGSPPRAGWGHGRRDGGHGPRRGVRPPRGAAAAGGGQLLSLLCLRALRSAAPGWGLDQAGGSAALLRGVKLPCPLPCPSLGESLVLCFFLEFFSSSDPAEDSALIRRLWVLTSQVGLSRRL